MNQEEAMNEARAQEARLTVSVLKSLAQRWINEVGDDLWAVSDAGDYPSVYIEDHDPFGVAYIIEETSQGPGEGELLCDYIAAVSPGNILRLIEAFEETHR